MSSSLRYNAENMLNTPSDFFNWLTIGGVDLVKGVVTPEEQFSKEHLLASFGLTTVFVGGVRTPNSLAGTVNKLPNSSPPKVKRTALSTRIKSSQKLAILTNIREWYRVNVPEIGFVYDSIGGYHLIVKKAEGGSGGGSRGSGKGSGNVKHLDDVPRIKEVEVNFKRNDKHESEEFARQLKDQEKGMNELTVDEYLKNRERYIEQGRAIEGNAAQQATREKALNKKIEELFESGMSWEEAEIKANSWLKTQAALHNPDQIAGGNPLNIGGMGDKRINSSIGSQWRYRIDIVDEQIGELAKVMTPEQRKNIYLNVKLTH